MKPFVNLMKLMMLMWLMPALVLALLATAPAMASPPAMANPPAMPESYVESPTAPVVVSGMDRYSLGFTGFSEQLEGTVVHDNPIFAFFRADRFEYRPAEQGGLLWDVDAWVGGRIHRLFFESEGSLSGFELNDVRFELLYTRAISAFWDVQAGVRHDVIPALRNRNFGTLGLQGVLPYRFEIEATLYVSDRGELSAIAEVEYDIRLSQRAVLQPRVETELALQSVPAYNIGSGINKFEAGLRLRYEIRREIAPYIGFSWERHLFETARLVKEDGEDEADTQLVAGLRLVF